MPRIVRCALIQARMRLVLSVLSPRSESDDRQTLKLIEQAARKKTQILCLQELFYGPYFCAEQKRAGMS